MAIHFYLNAVYKDHSGGRQGAGSTAQPGAAMTDFHNITQLFAIPAAHGDAATYVLAFLSSTAVELVAVACLISAFAIGGLRHLFQATADQDRHDGGGFRLDVVSLSKLVIPLACLTMTVWIYIATQGA